MDLEASWELKVSREAFLEDHSNEGDISIEKIKRKKRKRRRKEKMSSIMHSDMALQMKRHRLSSRKHLVSVSLSAAAAASSCFLWHHTLLEW